MESYPGVIGPALVADAVVIAVLLIVYAVCRIAGRGRKP